MDNAGTIRTIQYYIMKRDPHTTAVFQALIVTFLWSTSVVLVKIGLKDIPALTFAGMRYFLAFLILLPIFIFSNRLKGVRKWGRREWLLLIVLGILYYTITQGTMFLALDYLPAVNVSLLLNGTAIVVAILSILLLHENPSGVQYIGMLIFFAGVAVFFFPFRFPAGQVIGYLIAGIHLLATSLSSILGRYINRQRKIDPLSVTTISMGIGASLLLGIGLVVEPAPRMNLTNWLIVLFLAVVNTAVAFTIWNKTLQTLSATESTVINNTMLFQIAILAWIFLGEALTLVQIAGLLVAFFGALIVQLQPGKRLPAGT
jgi:drug/metabolite transporter (DMT)-like permease